MSYFDLAISPYNYCGNDSINRFDADDLTLKKGDPKREAAAVKYNKNEKNSIDKENIVRKAFH